MKKFYLSCVSFLSVLLSSAIYTMEKNSRPDYSLHDRCISTLLRSQGPRNDEALLRLCDELHLDHDRVMPYAHQILYAVDQLHRLAPTATDLIVNRANNEFLQRAYDILKSAYPTVDDGTIKQRIQTIFAESHKRSAEKISDGGNQASSTAVEDVFSVQYLVRDCIAPLLTLPDQCRLAQSSKTFLSLLMQSNREIVLKQFARRMRNPINYIVNKAHGSASVTIDGISFPTEQVLDYLFDHIAEILIANKYDPIRYVLNAAKGNPTVIIYGKIFDTTKLLNQLYDCGADINKTADYIHKAAGDANQPELPLLDRINLPNAVCQRLTEDQRLDVAQWHIIDADERDGSEEEDDDDDSDVTYKRNLDKKMRSYCSRTSR